MSTVSTAADFALHFGTGGIRALMGAGPKRLNAGTIAVATQGLAAWLLSQRAKCHVAIARDCRENGDEFVRVACEVLAGNGIRVTDLGVAPTPLLSFAVRDLGCDAGVVITASHNARQWNGYKVYGPDGCQATTCICKAIANAIDKVGVVRTATQKGVDGLVKPADACLAERYATELAQEVPSDGCGEHTMRIAYSPLNGTGCRLVPQVLTDDGFDCVVVPEQAELDGSFSTCPYPNPEDESAMKMTVELALRKGCDLALATDPDADRVGVFVRHGERLVHLPGDEVGELLLDWICRMSEARGEDLGDKIAVSTIVTSAALDAICARHGLALRRTLTGFKYVGEQIGRLESEGRKEDFLLGVEESLGYLSGTYVRDKDGIQGCLLVARMARWHAAQGNDLVQALDQLRGGTGWFLKSQVSIPFESEQDMASIMDRVRNDPPARVADLLLCSIADYAEGAPMPGDSSQTLPPANVLQWDLENNCRMIVRPSGTEPKLKVYCFAQGEDKERAQARLLALENDAKQLFG